jgi:hypothetical protein
VDLSDHEADLQQLEVDLRELQLRQTSIQEAIREVGMFRRAMYTRLAQPGIHMACKGELTVTSRRAEDCGACPPRGQGAQ